MTTEGEGFAPSPSYIKEVFAVAKKFTVMDFVSAIGSLSDEIPVLVKCGKDVVCKSKSLRYLASHGMPCELEAKVREINICRNRIELRIQPKTYNTKI